MSGWDKGGKVFGCYYVQKAKKGKKGGAFIYRISNFEFEKIKKNFFL